MNEKKAKNRIYVSFDPETFEQIKSIAKREHKSMSEIVRNATVDSITLKVNQENINMITSIIREQLRDVMQPSVERLATLSAKTCVQSATAAYLTAETINRFVPLSQQEDVVSVYTAARKKAVLYTRSKTTLEDGKDE